MTLILALFACAQTPRPCVDDAKNLVDGAEPLTCADAVVVPHLVERIAGRPLTANDRDAVFADVAQAFRADPKATHARIEDARDGLGVLSGLSGLDGARRRAVMEYEALHGDGLLAGWPEDVRTTTARAVSEWARSDPERVVLAESDIEGFLRYASLCREVQAGGALRLSIADRSTVYSALVKRFNEGSEADRTAILGIGSGFWAAKGAWTDASYDVQQEFAHGAPLPPPMTANSVDYALAIVAGDLPAHAANLHAALGPLAIEPAPEGP